MRQKRVWSFPNMLANSEGKQQKPTCENILAGLQRHKNQWYKKFHINHPKYPTNDFSSHYEEYFTKKATSFTEIELSVASEQGV